MIRDITLGQYYQADSVFHKMDSRTKLIVIFAYIISLFIFTNIYVYIIAFLFLAIGIINSKVPLKFIVRGMKPIAVLLFFTVFFNMLFVEGEPIFAYGIIKISKEGLITTAYTVIRLIFLVIGSSLLTLTTTPNNLTDGLEYILKPMKIIKVPVHEISMMISIALRFIPILLEETDRIMKAQLARGADFESGNIIKRAKSLIPILIPLFVSAFRRANDLAMAMEARCYRGGEGRSKMKPLKYNSRDYICYFCLIIYIIAIIFLGIYGSKINQIILQIFL